MTARIDPNYRRRYPGAPPFADLPLHRKLFFGREADARNLVDTILAESLVVVYARSGSGKTSLINVAVKERLRSEGYAPMVVRIGKHDQNPIEAIFQGIAQSAIEQGFEHHSRTTASLWHYFKTVEFWRGDTLLKPVLVIDQFEELFTLHTPEERQLFARQLANLLRGPAPVPARPLPEDIGELSETPPAVKVVLSMREDFLAMVDELVPDLPNILSTRFRLSPMDREQARQAIEGPAGVADVALESPTFTYTEGTVGKMIDFLAEGGSPGVVDQEGINPFQVQIVCQHVEDLVLARTRARTQGRPAPIAISYEDLGGATGLRETVSQFYERQLNNFNPYLRRRIQRLCEEGLANREGRRIAQEQSEIVNRFGVDTRTLGRLVDLRLLQRERRLGGNHYELSHDTLLHPVLNARRRRAQRRRTWRLSAAVAVLGVALLTMLWFLWRSNLRGEVADYVRRSYQNESDSENRLIHAVAAVARSLRVTNLDPSALKALSEAEQVPTVFKTPLPKDVTRAALSPNGQILALARAGALELRYPVDESFSRSLQPAFTTPISMIVFAPQGDRIAAASGRDVRVWDIAGRELGVVTASDEVTAIAFDPLMEGPSLAVATSSGSWSRVISHERKWTMGSPAVLQAPRPTSSTPDAIPPVLRSLQFSPNGAWIVGAAHGAMAHAWTRSGLHIRSMPVDAGMRKWTSWQDPKTAKPRWLASIAGGRVIVFDAERGFAAQTLAMGDSGAAAVAATLSDIETDHRPAEIAFSPDGKYLAVGTLSGDTHVFQFDPAARTFAFRDRFGGQLQKPIRGLSWSPTDYHLLTMQEGASALRAIEAAATYGAGNQTAGARPVDLARELREAPVSRQQFALDRGGAVLTHYMDDWIKVIQPPASPIRAEVFNPRVLPVENDWLFATETAEGFALKLWEQPGRDTKIRWDGLWRGDLTLRAASRTASELFVVAAGRPSTRETSPYDSMGQTPSRVLDTSGLRLYRGPRSGTVGAAKMTEVSISGFTSEIAHAVALADGNFLVTSVDGAVSGLSPTGMITPMARVGAVPNLAFDQRGRLMSWLHGGAPTRWDLRNPGPNDMIVDKTPTLQEVSVRNNSRVAVQQAIVAVADGEFVIADDVGDVHLVETLESGTELRYRRVIKARAGEVRQLVAGSTSAVALISGDASGALSVVHIRGRSEARMQAMFDGSAITIGDRGRFVAMLNPDKQNPEIRLSGADLEETASILNFAGRCHPSAIAASPTNDVLIVGCREGLMAAVTPSGIGLPHPEPAFDPAPAECWFERPPAGDPPIESSVVALAFAPSGRFFVGVARHKIAVWNADGSLRVKALAPPFQVKDDWITSVAVAPNEVVAIGTAKGTLILMTLDGSALRERGSALQAMMTSSITAIAFSPNGRQILAGFDNGSIQPYERRWWWSRTFSPVQTELTTEARLVSLAFTPDGERIASGGANGEVRLWSSTYEPIAAPFHLSGSPTAIAFSPDGLRMIASSDVTLEGTATVSTASWMSEACDRLSWSPRLRNDAADPIVAIVRDACRPVWQQRQSGTSLIEAAATGRIDVVEALLAGNVDPNAADESGRTPLMRAVARGHAAVAQILMAKGVDLTRRDALGATVLHHAAGADARSIVPSLLQAGLPVNQADQNGRTPLMLASSKGHRALVQMLVDQKADVNLADEFGWTALMNAAEADSTEIVSLLIGAGAEINARERVRLSFGKTAGQLARAQVESEMRAQHGKTAVINLTPMMLFRLPIEGLATNDAERRRAERLIAWRRGGMDAAETAALARELADAVTAAGQQPNANDLVLLGLSRGFGLGGKPDWQAAKQEFVRASALKSKLADTFLSVLMLEGVGEAQQFTEAVNRLEAAANAADADPLGAWLVAVLHRDRYLGGDAGEREARAREFMKIATAGGGARFGPAWNSQAFIDVNDPRRIEQELAKPCAALVRASLENASKSGDAVAASNLAEWAWYGRDPGALEKLTAALALAGRTLPISQKPLRLEHLATFRLGISHAYGIGTARDYAQAIKWLTESAQGGNYEASRELGRMYELGLGVAPSLATAVTHYRRAAADGDVYARNRLNVLGYAH